MKRHAALMMPLVVVLLNSLPAAEKEKKPAAPPGISRESFDGAVRVEAVVPGRLISYALPRNAAGLREVILLVAPDPVPAASSSQDSRNPPDAPCAATGPKESEPDRPRLLIRLNESGAGTLDLLRDDLPADAFTLDAIDRDADGTDELLLARPGRVEMIRDESGRRFAGGPDLLMADPNLRPGAIDPLRPRPIRAPANRQADLLPIDLLGGARFYGPSLDGRSWDLLYEARLPIETVKDAAGLKLSSPRIARAGISPSGTTLFASGPEPQGHRRLRSILIDPSNEGEARRVECWSLLPEPEALLESAYLMLDGRPALLVTTRPAEKLSLFGEKLLRLFLLEGNDRSRTGNAPVLALESRINLWQPVTPIVIDVNHDGREDLVAAYWKGLKDSRVVLDLYLRQQDGSFSRSPVETAFDVERGSRSMVGYGRDLDADGAADLILVANGRMLVFPGSRVSRGGKEIVAARPRWSVPIEGDWFGVADWDFDLSTVSKGIRARPPFGGPGAPQPADLDGDGRPEVLFATPDERGHGRFEIIHLPPS